MPVVGPDVSALVILLNVAGLGYIAYLLVTRVAPAVDATARETRMTVDSNTRAVNRLVRGWALYLISERRDISDRVKREAQSVLDEIGSEGPDAR